MKDIGSGGKIKIVDSEVPKLPYEVLIEDVLQIMNVFIAKNE